MKALELKIPPVVVVLGFGLAMWFVARAMPRFHFGFSASRFLALALVSSGVFVAALGFFSFRRAGTTVHPMKPESSSALVDSGIYRVTRNPMYLGFLFWLTGWAVYLSHPVALLLLPLFVLYMNAFQIKPEERALHALFGQKFELYRARVRRWL